MLNIADDPADDLDEDQDFDESGHGRQDFFPADDNMYARRAQACV